MPEPRNSSFRYLDTKPITQEEEANIRAILETPYEEIFDLARFTDDEAAEHGRSSSDLGVYE